MRRDVPIISNRRDITIFAFDMTAPISPNAHFVFTHPVHLIAFGFGAGLSPVGSGTMGTLVAVPLCLWLQGLPSFAYWLLTGLLLLSGFWICDYTSRSLGTHDHSGIVWDEIVGYLITMGIAPRGWEWVMAGFLLFRFFDVVKPWPVSWVDRSVGGGFGIMLDDAVAGLYSLAVLQVLAVMLGAFRT
jgi:phosphatidylglycerophosphatase A